MSLSFFLSFTCPMVEREDNTMEYGTKLIINSVVRGTTDVIKKVAPAVLTGDMILFNGEKIIKPSINTISNIGSKIKSKLVKNSNIQ